MHAIFDGVIPDVVGRAIDEPGLHAPAGHPDRVAVRIVVAAVASLRHRRAAKLTGPDNQRVLQQTARLQVLQQSRDRLVDLIGVLGVLVE